MKEMTNNVLLISCLILLLADSAFAANPFTPGSQPTGWVSKPEVSFTRSVGNHYDLSSGNETFYQLDFRKDTWSGNVLAQDIDKTARVQTTGPWDGFDPTLTTAASLLDQVDFNTGRKIATFGGAFRWASLSNAEKAAIGSEKAFNFVRGDRSNEEPNGLSFYRRSSVLGNIIHSTINFWDDGTHQTLFVGANDGMLHAFDAATGAERWAYVPSMLIPKLHKLVEKDFVHTYFVDGPLTIGEMNISGMKTILVGALGAGGKGLFAMDVTSALAESEAAVADKVMWEITATGGFANLGYTYGTPLLSRLNDGSAVVIAANGYMNSGNGHAVLYVINATTGALVKAYDTNAGSLTSPNGLSSPTLYDSDGDLIPEYAYAGDIDGNLWKFDLDGTTVTKIMSTSDGQAITTAPVVQMHPLGGQMIAFGTGRILTSGDVEDQNIDNVYGVWDGAPDSNKSFVTQTLTPGSYDGVPVRAVSTNALNWNPGQNRGWKVELPPGERVVGEKPFYNNGRFYFLSTNPSIDPTENWLHELVFLTGGAPLAPIYDLNKDGAWGKDDMVTINGSRKVPIAKFLGPGAFSQPLLVSGYGLSTTLYTYHPDLPVSGGLPISPDDPGVSGGHFDFDIYYLPRMVEETIYVPIGGSRTDTVCMKTRDIESEYKTIAEVSCVANADIPDGYSYLDEYTTGSPCGNDKNTFNQQVLCRRVLERTVNTGDYKNSKHVHEYDDKYDVTGVNMLNASLADFNLVNALPDETIEFKVLVMNQYLNPAALLSVGNVNAYESVKTYGNLASESDAETLLAGLPTYNRSNITTLIFNLPLDAFKSRDWWGDGGAVRAGLIPTQTGCVNKVSLDGESAGLGPNGERYNGALTIQLIRADTPSDQLEMNGPDVSYGWRLKQANFTNYALAEYTAFWHHPNGACYGDDDWVPDPPQDFKSDANPRDKAEGSTDPTDGIFGAGLSSTTVVTTDGNVTTTVITYSDGKQYVKTETLNDNGSTTIKQVFRDGTEEEVTIYSGMGGSSGFIDPNTGSPLEEVATGSEGRQSWRDIID